MKGVQNLWIEGDLVVEIRRNHISMPTDGVNILRWNQSCSMNYEVVFCYNGLQLHIRWRAR